ncbi:APC family permease [Sciscionella sediminilitoris]|uniref:APC family permease n=1 Tax=Sciscionella sediminilitoris TaxID=1445613 RepID=UPI0004DED0E8|nr:amino acid permease [Sciscionella sp. SE31]
MTTPTTSLRRTLGTFRLLVFGLTYLGIGAVFTVYGSGVAATDGHLPAAYLVATVAMLFTAHSYGRMAVRYPAAGSAYTYAQQSFGGYAGFLTGWALLLDYLLLPLINFLLVGIYLHEQFPALPRDVMMLSALLVVLGLNVLGLTVAIRLNLILVGAGALLTVLFVVLSIRYTTTNSGPVNVFGGFVPNGGAGPIFAGASVLALSFLGFDAVSTLAEEARRPKRDVPRAIVLTVLVGGLFFIAVAWAGSIVFPDWHAITNLEAAGFSLMGRVGGAALVSAFLVINVVGSVLCGTAAQVSTARVLYAMGRDGILPRPLAYLHPRFRTPVVAACTVAVVSLVGLLLDLNTAMEIVNFGALAAFSMVNLALLRSFLGDRAARSPRRWITHAVAPGVGFVLTVWLWTSLSWLTFLVGLCWLTVGAAVLAARTRLFTRRPPMLDLSETETLETTVPQQK